MACTPCLPLRQMNEQKGPGLKDAERAAKWSLWRRNWSRFWNTPTQLNTHVKSLHQEDHCTSDPACIAECGSLNVFIVRMLFAHGPFESSCLRADYRQRQANIVRSMVGGCPLTVASQNCQNRHLSSKENNKYLRYWCKRWFVLVCHFMPTSLACKSPAN